MTVRINSREITTIKRRSKEVSTVKMNAKEILTVKGRSKEVLAVRMNLREVLTAKMKGRGGPNGHGEVQMDTKRSKGTQEGSNEHKGGQKIKQESSRKEKFNSN